MQPSVSIVIPTYSRPRQLKQCLHTLSELDFDRTRTEVVIVDDGSRQDLGAVVAPFRKVIEVSLVRQDNRGPGIARNAGVACSSGEIIAFTDDDCSPQPGWIDALVRSLKNDHQTLVGGRVDNRLVGNSYSRASQLLVDYALRHTEMRFFTTNNIACYADSFKEMGGFSVQFSNVSEDREFSYRWQHAGNKLCYSPEAVVLHAHELSAFSFWRQQYNYGKGAYNFHKLLAQANQGAIEVERFSFYSGLLLKPFTDKNADSDPLTLASLVFLSQVAIATGFFAQLTKCKMALPAQTIRSPIHSFTHDGTQKKLCLSLLDKPVNSTNSLHQVENVVLQN